MNRVAPESEPSVSATRAAIRAAYAIDEADAVRKLVARLDLPPERRKAITGAAAGIIQQVRDDTDPTMMEGCSAQAIYLACAARRRFSRFSPGELATQCKG